MALTSTKPRKDIGQRLKAERERLGFSEAQIASLLGMPLEQYQQCESGDLDLGLFKASRLSSVGFDILFIATQERHNPIREENELLARFRNLSLRGKASMFSTLDALEKLAPNLSQKIRDTLNSVRK